MKRITSILLILFCFTLSGCNQKITSDSSAIKNQNNTLKEFLNITGAMLSNDEMYISYIIPLDYKQFDSPDSGEFFGNKTPYTLELINEKNKLINKYKFGTSEMRAMTDSGDRLSDSGMFSLSVPYEQSVKKVIIKKDKNILFEQVRSLHAPKVKINNPQNNLESIKEVNIVWNGSDDDKDELWYRLEVGSDKDKENWSPYLAYDKVLSKQINLDSGKNVIRVACTDGLNTTYDYINLIFNDPNK